MTSPAKRKNQNLTLKTLDESSRSSEEASILSLRRQICLLHPRRRRRDNPRAEKPLTDQTRNLRRTTNNLGQRNLQHWCFDRVRHPRPKNLLLRACQKNTPPKGERRPLECPNYLLACNSTMKQPLWKTHPRQSRICALEPRSQA
jgi:hypothetical protein